MVSVSDTIPMLLLYMGCVEEGVEFSGEKKIFYFCCRRGRKRGEKEKRSAVLRKHTLLLCFFGCGARHSRLRQPVGSVPRKGYGITDQGAETVAAGRFFIPG
ncbi:hypothetical protein [Intestinimonas sp. MSJ-38]|uniref:hypothetical protein n=1 Tax=Intestinimonas sp. MSJ-38 TaxID=2841532 RepID=UPI001C0F8EC7|nr:hypothetical protein [Intestinimonas sp. MSJ-38]MBU5432603.1 hypothetical protein [Intestinimonas sp. MSJ-38]